MRIRPEGSASARSTDASAPCRASNRRWPSSVSDMSRVVRCSRRTFSRCSSVLRCCERAARETPISAAAVVVAHPGGGVKGQAAGLYAGKLAENGLIAIAFDASYQGQSTGLPRQLETPYIRTEDISAVIDHLTTLPYVDASRIGAMGICAGGGYAANAAINDRRIKAVGTVSAVNIGQMFRNGWENTVKDTDAVGYIEFGSQARTADAGRPEPATLPLAPMREEDAPNLRAIKHWNFYHDHDHEGRHLPQPGLGNRRRPLPATQLRRRQGVPRHRQHPPHGQLQRADRGQRLCQGAGPGRLSSCWCTTRASRAPAAACRASSKTLRSASPTSASPWTTCNRCPSWMPGASAPSACAAAAPTPCVRVSPITASRPWRRSRA